MTTRRSELREALRAATLCLVAAVTTAWAGCFGCPCGSGPSTMHLVADPIDWPEIEDATDVTLAVTLVENVEKSEFAEEGDEPMVYEGELLLVRVFSGGWMLPVDSEPFALGGCPMVGDATFELFVEGTEFEPITIEVHPDYGGSDTVELWNGWEVEIQWGGWIA